MAKPSSSEDYNVSLEEGSRQLDVSWTAPDSIKRLFQNRKVSWSVKDQEEYWTEGDLAEEIKLMMEAFEKRIDASEEELSDVKASVKRFDKEMIDKDSKIVEEKENLKKKEEELAEKESALIELEKKLLERGTPKHGRRSSISDLEAARNGLQISLRNAHADIESIVAKKYRVEQNVVKMQSFILRSHVYGAPNGSPEIVDACREMMKRAAAASTYKEVRKVGRFYDMKGVVFASQFDDFPFLPDRHLNISIMLTVLGDYTDTTVDSHELCGHLAWLNTALGDINEVHSSEQFAALHRFLQPVITRDLTGLAASLRSMAVANLGQRNENLSFYAQNLAESAEASRLTYPWTAWTALEKVAHLWMMALHRIPGDWVAEVDAAAQQLWLHMYPPQCSDFIDVLEKSSRYLRGLDHVTLVVLASQEKENSDKLAILRFKSVSGQWQNYIWSRYSGKLSFTDRGLSLMVEVTGLSQIWSVRPRMAKAWFVVEEEEDFQYLETVYLEKMGEMVMRYVRAKETKTTTVVIN